MDIREAAANDMELLAPLMEQLGYPTTIESMKKDSAIFNPILSIIL